MRESWISSECFQNVRIFNYFEVVALAESKHKRIFNLIHWYYKVYFNKEELFVYFWCLFRKLTDHIWLLSAEPFTLLVAGLRGCGERRKKSRKQL